MPSNVVLGRAPRGLAARRARSAASSASGVDGTSSATGAAAAATASNGSAVTAPSRTRRIVRRELPRRTAGGARSATTGRAAPTGGSGARGAAGQTRLARTTRSAPSRPAARAKPISVSSWMSDMVFNRVVPVVAAPFKPVVYAVSQRADALAKRALPEPYKHHSGTLVRIAGVAALIGGVTAVLAWQRRRQIRERVALAAAMLRAASSEGGLLSMTTAAAQAQQAATELVTLKDSVAVLRQKEVRVLALLRHRLRHLRVRHQPHWDAILEELANETGEMSELGQYSDVEAHLLTLFDELESLSFAVANPSPAATGGTQAQTGEPDETGDATASSAVPRLVETPSPRREDDDATALLHAGDDVATSFAISPRTTTSLDMSPRSASVSATQAVRRVSDTPVLLPATAQQPQPLVVRASTAESPSPLLSSIVRSGAVSKAAAVTGDEANSSVD